MLSWRGRAHWWRPARYRGRRSMTPAAVWSASRLEARLRELTAKSELTPTELPELTQAAQSLYELARADLSRAQKLVDAGALPVKELEPYKSRLDSAQTRRDLVETRARLVRQLHAMASAEDRFEELEEEELAFAYEGDGEGGLWCGRPRPHHGALLRGVRACAAHQRRRRHGNPPRDGLRPHRARRRRAAPG